MGCSQHRFSRVFQFCYVISRYRVGSLLPNPAQFGHNEPNQVIQLLEKKSLVELELAVLKTIMGDNQVRPPLPRSAPTKWLSRPCGIAPAQPHLTKNRSTSGKAKQRANGERAISKRGFDQWLPKISTSTHHRYRRSSRLPMSSSRWLEALTRFRVEPVATTSH